jgi:hypothetical protein
MIDFIKSRNTMPGRIAHLAAAVALHPATSPRGRSYRAAMARDVAQMMIMGRADLARDPDLAALASAARVIIAEPIGPGPMTAAAIALRAGAWAAASAGRDAARDPAPRAASDRGGAA